VIGTKVKNHPAIMVSNTSWRQVRAFCSEFGLSLVSRTRLAIEKPDDDGYAEMMEILSRPRDDIDKIKYSRLLAAGRR
jgi:P27 family predicted phage terminase small subunit